HDFVQATSSPNCNAPPPGFGPATTPSYKRPPHRSHHPTDDTPAQDNSMPAHSCSSAKSPSSSARPHPRTARAQSNPSPPTTPSAPAACSRSISPPTPKRKSHKIRGSAAIPRLELGTWNLELEYSPFDIRNL